MKRTLKIYCFGPLDEFRFYFFIQIPVLPLTKKNKEEQKKENEQKIKKIMLLRIKKGIKNVKEQFKNKSYGASFGKIKVAKCNNETFKM